MFGSSPNTPDSEAPMTAPEKPQLLPTRYLASNPLTAANIRVCPECAGPVIRNSGCVTCRQCGWGRCG